MYVVAEEEPDNAEDNGNVIVLSSMWLTPRKVECFWPNNKLSKQFNKILQKHHEPQEDWSLIKLKRKFFETEFINNNHLEIKTPEPAYTPSPLVPSHRTPQRMTTTCSSNTPVNHVLTGSSSQRSAVSSVENCVAGTTGATKKMFKLQTDKEIEDNIKVWLKHAPQRTKLEQKKILARIDYSV
ncbi:hypothetical protein ACJJTC_006856 [Scirpophaga incertulas]